MDHNNVVFVRIAGSASVSNQFNDASTHTHTHSLTPTFIQPPSLSIANRFIKRPMNPATINKIDHHQINNPQLHCYKFIRKFVLEHQQMRRKKWQPLHLYWSNQINILYLFHGIFGCIGFDHSE